MEGITTDSTRKRQNKIKVRLYRACCVELPWNRDIRERLGG